MLLSFLWCRRRDLNPHGFPHTPLKRARIPIPPRRHIYLIFNYRVYLPSRKTIFNRFSRQSATSTYIFNFQLPRIPPLSQKRYSIVFVRQSATLTSIFNFQQKLYYHKHNFCKNPLCFKTCR